jgi:hypothetical protein
MLLGKAVMINWSDVAPEHRSAYYEWHSREHMVGRVAIPGFRRGRRYIAARARRNFLVMYEVEDLSVLTGAAYLAKANAPSAFTRRTTPYVKNSVRGLARVQATSGIGTGGCALTVRFDPAGGCDEELARYLVQEALPRAAARPDITGAHLLVADPSASGIVPVERAGRPTVIPNWIVLIEGVSPDALQDVDEDLLADTRLHGQGCAPGVERDTYSLQIMVMSEGGRGKREE